MITINPVNFNKNTKKYISFTEKNIDRNANNNSKVGLMSLDKRPSNRINFEKDLHDTKKADMVQSNPIKAIGYNFVKAYNILCTPKRRATQTESNYVHIPYMYMA
ncbi:MAG: hypothetical protein ACI37Q_01115 [Candidatus Gastranaerophilaceae bacterium]